MGNDHQTRNRRSPAAFAQGALAIIAWLVIWQLIAVALGNPWLLSGPAETDAVEEASVDGEAQSESAAETDTDSLSL